MSSLFAKFIITTQTPTSLRSYWSSPITLPSSCKLKTVRGYAHLSAVYLGTRSSTLSSQICHLRRCSGSTIISLPPYRLGLETTSTRWKPMPGPTKSSWETGGFSCLTIPSLVTYNRSYATVHARLERADIREGRSVRHLLRVERLINRREKPGPCCSGWPLDQAGVAAPDRRAPVPFSAGKKGRYGRELSGMWQQYVPKTKRVRFLGR